MHTFHVAVRYFLRRLVCPRLVRWGARCDDARLWCKAPLDLSRVITFQLRWEWRCALGWTRFARAVPTSLCSSVVEHGGQMQYRDAAISIEVAPGMTAGKQAQAAWQSRTGLEIGPRQESALILRGEPSSVRLFLLVGRSGGILLAAAPKSLSGAGLQLSTAVATKAAAHHRTSQLKWRKRDVGWAHVAKPFYATHHTHSHSSELRRAAVQAPYPRCANSRPFLFLVSRLCFGRADDSSPPGCPPHRTQLRLRSFSSSATLAPCLPSFLSFSFKAVQGSGVDSAWHHGLGIRIEVLAALALYAYSICGS